MGLGEWLNWDWDSGTGRVAEPELGEWLNWDWDRESGWDWESG